MDIAGAIITCLPPVGRCAEKPGGSGMLDVFFERDGGGLLSSTAHRGGGGGGEVCFSITMITGEMWYLPEVETIRSIVQKVAG
jgi:hypothetical protein